MKKATAWMAVCGLVLGAGWVAAGPAMEGGDGGQHVEKKQTAEIGQPAPDFTLVDLDGKRHRLKDLKGKIVVLEWTNHQCPFVKRHQVEEKTMQALYKKYVTDRKEENKESKSGPEVAWLAINSSYFVNDAKDDMKKYVADSKIEYPILLDPDGRVGKLYDAKTTPQMFIVDADGKLAYMGAVDDDDRGAKKPEERRDYVSEALDALIRGSEVSKSKTRSYGCSVKYGK